MKKISKLTMAFAIFTISTHVLFSQTTEDSLVIRYNQFVQEKSPEKLFIHTDKSFYVAGEHIWFKGYLQNSTDYSLLDESLFIYVELYGDTLVSRIKVKYGEDGFSGKIPLQYDLRSGEYTLRGYSRWMLNRNPDYMFHKKIRIINPVLDKMAKEELQKEQPKPGTQTDTPPQVKAPDMLPISIRFFPESGRLIPDMFSVVAFKVTDMQGRGLELSGFLCNSKDSVITGISTFHKGMGSFRFLNRKDETYHVKVTDTAGTIHKFPLPASESYGAQINVVSREAKIYINTSFTPGMNLDFAHVIIHDGDKILFVDKQTNNGKVTILDKTNLAPGVNHILMADQNFNIIAERLFFKHPGFTETLSLEKAKTDEELDRRDNQTIYLKLRDSIGNPLVGEFSISVTDSFLAPPDPDGPNLIAHTLLTSELEGVVEDPSWYLLPPSREREVATDLLMMVHGWRYYDLPAILSPAANTKKESKWIHKEYTQSVSGRATSLFRNTKRATISVYAPAIDLVINENLNSSGYFIVSDIDFPDSTGFVISCTGRQGQKGYYIEMDRPIIPPLCNYAFLNSRTAEPDSLKEKFYTQIFMDSGGDKATLLQPAIVTASNRITPKHNPSPFNQTFDRRQIRERADLKEYPGLSLYDYILVNFAGVQRGGYDLETGLRELASTRGTTMFGGNEPFVVFINKIQARNSDIDLYTVDEVENVALLKGNDAHLYLSRSGVILVTLRTSMSENSRELGYTTNILVDYPLGWQKPSRFYSPDYSLQKDNDAVSFDNRSTLYWNPKVTTNEQGEATITYYSSDRKTRHTISVEGMTNEGEVFSLRK